MTTPLPSATAINALLSSVVATATCLDEASISCCSFSCCFCSCQSFCWISHCSVCCCFRCSSINRRCSFVAASGHKSIAVLPSISNVFVPAPCFTNRFTIGRLPVAAAAMRGVQPSSPSAVLSNSALAPCCSSTATTAS